LHFKLETALASAEYNAIKLAEAIGGYMFAVGLMEKLTESECGYAIKKGYSYTAELNEALPYFNEPDRKEILSRATAPKMQKEIAAYLDAMRDDLTKLLADEKTRCGSMVTTLSLMYAAAKQRWESAKQIYSR
jgi:hypothetical protein